MIYIKRLTLPSDYAEIEFIKNEKRTCFHTFYPFKIFPDKGMRHVEFEGITMFYGGNGSGKSTLLNVIARKMGAARYSEFNDSPLFDQFVDMCYLEYAKRPRASFVLTSDDVFDYALSARAINEGIDDQRNQLFDKYVAVHQAMDSDPEMGQLHGLDDYERWREVREILSPKKSQSSYVKKRVVQDIDLCSNGETAMRYFLDRIEDDGVYFLDEPENSLSIERQIELADYIAATERAGRCQFIIATHSPIFLSMRHAKIYNLDDYPASVCPWTELPNVRKYFDFFMQHRDDFE
ncbi:MAG: AAA family ATPase [Clostridia bacterium]|nr:AAA family ATPase [Clostridia bacterium]